MHENRVMFAIVLLTACSEPGVDPTDTSGATSSDSTESGQGDGDGDAAGCASVCAEECSSDARTTLNQNKAQIAQATFQILCVLFVPFCGLISSSRRVLVFVLR